MPHVTGVTLYPQDLFLGIIRILKQGKENMHNNQLLNAIKHHAEHSWIWKHAQKVIEEKQKERWKTLLFVNIWTYDERSDGSHMPTNKTDFLTFLSLMLCWCFEEKQRSFASGDFWVLARWQLGPSFPRWRPCQIPDPRALGQCINVKIPTQGKALSVNFLWVACTPPPP